VPSVVIIAALQRQRRNVGDPGEDRFSKIGINHVDIAFAPPEFAGTLGKGVL